MQRILLLSGAVSVEVGDHYGKFVSMLGSMDHGISIHVSPVSYFFFLFSIGFVFLSSITWSCSFSSIRCDDVMIFMKPVD